MNCTRILPVLLLLLLAGTAFADVGQPAPYASRALKTATGTVDVAAAAAPSAVGQVLKVTATGATATATWQTPVQVRQSFNTTGINVGLTAAQANTLWVNSAAVEITLPATGGMTTGDWFIFIVNHNSYLRVNCAAGGVDTARYPTGVTAPSGYFRSTTVSDSIEVIYLGGTEWKIRNLAGTWTYDS